MGSDSNVPITAGSGTTIDTFALAGGDHQQVVREARATAVTTNSWTVSTTASTSQIAADVNRVLIIMTNQSTVRVYLRFDSTAPTSSTYHWYLDPGDRWEIPSELCTLAISMLGAATASGSMHSLLATAS
jgi:hypothetical protein